MGLLGKLFIKELSQRLTLFFFFFSLHFTRRFTGPDCRTTAWRCNRHLTKMELKAMVSDEKGQSSK